MMRTALALAVLLASGAAACEEECATAGAL